MPQPGPAVGNDEDAEALVRSACFARAEEARRRSVAHAPKSPQNGFEAEADVSCDVLEDEPFRLDLSDDALDVGPQVTLIILATTLTGGAERLARVSRKDRVDTPAPVIAHECAQVAPHRGRPERSGAPSRCGGRSSGFNLGAIFGETGQMPSHHSCDDRGLGDGILLNKADGMKVWLCELQAEVEAPVSCAEGEAVSWSVGM